ncbi:MAG TPA: hypothetical protein VFA27_15865 [Vicinamibacterales bacterium]|nr:hypothetical protein [Vicinamibacterales bacterium]
MDAETVDAIDRLSDRIDRLEVSLRGEMAQMQDGLRGEMSRMGDDLRAEFRTGLSENRRHADVLFESLRDDIRLVAEGVAHLAVKIDRLQR